MAHLPQRRPLTLPAVPPCEAILPATLLASLATIARDIVEFFACEHFPAHRRSVRELLRQVLVVLAFLDDARDRGSVVPESAVLSFAELHIAFQKIRLLLHDCSRRGARLWILMQHSRISNELRGIFGSIATALDVVPLEEMEVSDEMKELVRMVARQAWGVVVESDPADEAAAKMVMLMLKQFRNGVAPERHFIKQVMDHIRISRWVECHDEVSFLEAEISSCGGESSNSDAGLVSGFLGIMIYCRAVLFDVAAGDARTANDRKARKSQSSVVVDHLNPEYLRCPISLDLMTDPVTVSTGQTYDRSSISRWLAAGCLTCPVTGEKLATTELVPNSVLRKLVEQFCWENNVQLPHQRSQNRDLSMTQKPGSPAAAGAIRMTASFLVEKLWTGTDEEKVKAAYEMRLMTKSSLFNRGCVVEAGGVQCLLDALSSSDSSMQEHAAAALLNVSKIPLGRIATFEYGGVRPVLRVMKAGLKAEAQQNAAAILFYLSSVEEYRKEIGELPEAIPALVELLRRGTYRGKKNAVVTLFGLLMFPGNHARVIAAGAIPALIDILTTEREDLINDAVAVLAKMAEGPEGTKEILRCSVVPLLVEVLKSSSSQSGKGYCVAVLLSLCNNGGAKVARLLNDLPSLMPSLYSLLTEGSPHAAKKARSLLDYLHRFQDQSCSAEPFPPARDHWFVHAQ